MTSERFCAFCGDDNEPGQPFRRRVDDLRTGALEQLPECVKCRAERNHSGTTVVTGLRHLAKSLPAPVWESDRARLEQAASLLEEARDNIIGRSQTHPLRTMEARLLARLLGDG